jgi:hypothetical protein
MGCPQCLGQRTTQIEINLKGDEAVRFYSCRRCEAKWWERGGGTVALDEVLNLTAQREKR